MPGRHWSTHEVQHTYDLVAASNFLPPLPPSLLAQHRASRTSDLTPPAKHLSSWRVRRYVCNRSTYAQRPHSFVWSNSVTHPEMCHTASGCRRNLSWQQVFELDCNIIAIRFVSFCIFIDFGWFDAMQVWISSDVMLKLVYIADHQKRWCVFCSPCCKVSK